MLKKILVAATIMTFLWLGLWVMLIQGICEIIQQCQADTTNYLTLVLAITKIALFELPIIAALYISIFYWPRPLEDWE